MRNPLEPQFGPPFPVPADSGPRPLGVTPNSVKPVGPIEVGLSRLRTVVAELQLDLGILHDRLGPVLCSAPSTSVSVGRDRDQPPSGHTGGSSSAAIALDVICNDVEDLRANLRATISRLEV